MSVKTIKFACKFYFMKKIFLLFSLSIIVLAINAQRKREFRGAWIQAVNGQFQGMGREAMQQMLSYQLDELAADGVNAIIFQVRPECDALYASKIEPWSRYLTGYQGRVPEPYWDPLQWMVEQCHKRGMELHAWINPFRAKTKGTVALAANHIATLHPERVFRYDNQLILDPSLPENTTYICQVVSDIVSRYDIDGLHIDDYFYPYPASGETIPDEAHFQQCPNGFKTIGDWRRDHVNRFIKKMGETIHECKPWVKFGVSPFGIFRNKTSDSIGSATRGLQNYDDLYADVLLWINNGWIDYCVPQLYWQIGHPTADYETLIRWWDAHANHRPLFIGEDVERTVRYPDIQHPQVHQMAAKYALHQQLLHINGTVLWYAKTTVDNIGNYGSLLRNHYWHYPALPPAMPFLDSKAPRSPRSVKPTWTSDGYLLFWKAPKAKHWGDIVNRYVIYRFRKGEPIDLEDPTKLVKITSNTMYKLPYQDGTHQYTYVVTSLDRVGNESKGQKKKIKL